MKKTLMDKVLEKSKYLILIAVIFSLLGAMTAFIIGAVKTVKIIGAVIETYATDPVAAIGLVDVMDIFLIATALLIFSTGLYELFIHDINLPGWLTIKNLHDLKAKVSSVVILVMGVTFLKHLVEWKDPLGTLFFGAAIAVVSASLIAFSHFGGKD